MSGYDVARALRAAATPARLLAVSGYAQPDDVTNALAAGFHGHLAKPVSLQEIERLLT
jgi:CheY-like chemotaxis protein